MELRPLAGHVYIEAIAPVESKGLIVIPESVSRTDQSSGRIVAEAETEVTVGHYALFRPRSGDVFSIRGRTFYNVKEGDILLVTDSEEQFQRLSQPA